MLLRPLNDKQCLTLLHEDTRRVMHLPENQALAATFISMDELIEYILNLDQRDEPRR